MNRALLLILFLWFTSVSLSNLAAAKTAVNAAGPEELAAAFGDRITRVPEFAFIREEGEKLGVRVYLFGGTAAAYAHYVRQDLAREAGDTRYPNFLYDYDYTNIFRSTQDLDVVVDGPPEKAAELESLLKKKFPHFLGGKNAQWEVRSLREARGDKEAILGNPDFQNQHTDSHSTGLVEVTPAPKGELAVKDVRDWQAKEPQFLKDVAEQKLHYYFNPLHETTNRAKNGLNPPILSAIRYLTKAFQYDLQISGDDRAQIQRIVSEFNPGVRMNDYVSKWIEKNGKKLFQHAVDIEYAWKTLEDLGLREKLIAVKKDQAAQDTLAWWMSKEPLRTEAVGKGEGRTAAQIFGKELTFAHETNSFLAYESITRSKAGELNAFTSRGGKAGEAAMLGEGFYAKHGRQGARGTGITIRMELDPSARENSDFIYSSEYDYLVLKNKAAVKVLSEQINLSLLEYLKLLHAGKDFSYDDKALLESFRRRIGKSLAMGAGEEKEVVEFMMSAANEPSAPIGLWMEWFRMPISSEHPEIISAMVKNNANEKMQLWLIENILSQPKWLNPNWIKPLIAKATRENKIGQAIAINILAKPDSFAHPELMEAMVKNGTADVEVAKYSLGQHVWQGHPEWVKTILERDSADYYITKFVLNDPYWARFPGFGEILLKRGIKSQSTFLGIHELLKYPHWYHPEWMATLIERGERDASLVVDVLGKEQWAKNPEFIKTLIDRGHVDRQLLEFVLSKDHWAADPQWIDKIIKRECCDAEIAQYILSNPKWAGRADWLETIVKRGQADQELAKYVLGQPFSKIRPDLVEILIQRGKVNSDLAQYVLSQPGWSEYPELVRKLIAGGAKRELIFYVLPKAEWAAYPELVEDLVNAAPGEAMIIDNLILYQDHWKKVFEGKNINRLRELFASGFTYHKPFVAPRGCGPSFAELH